MGPDGQRILEHLAAVEAERARRGADPALARRVHAVKQWQHARFERTYADALASPRYRDAARFFLDDLYGPTDFAERDHQFARVVPGLVRLFPHELIETVKSLGELHALSEHFDSEMAAVLSGRQLDGATYGRAWREVGQPQGRELQIVLMLRVGSALDRYTRSAVLRHSLRLMRGPAHAAGLGALQEFLERGFDTFRAMRGADDFLRMIAERERSLATRLFAGEDVTGVTVSLEAIPRA